MPQLTREKMFTDIVHVCCGLRRKNTPVYPCFGKAGALIKMILIKDKKIAIPTLPEWLKNHQNNLFE